MDQYWCHDAAIFYKLVLFETKNFGVYQNQQYSIQLHIAFKLST
jgi:hypothetical protein